MKAIQVDVPEELAVEFQCHAEATGRSVSELVAAAMKLYLARVAKRQNAHSVLDIQPGSFGKPIKPWSSRAELLEDFFDRTD